MCYTKLQKNPLPLFFIDLGPAEINKEIFSISNLLHKKIKVEEPHKRREIIQCFNCQEYSHSKSYFSHPPKCVRCAAAHPTSSCTQSKEQPPTCALCGGNHPTSYRGCSVHKKLQRLHNASTNYKNNVIKNRNNIVSEDGGPSEKTSLDPPNINDSKAFPSFSQTQPPINNQSKKKSYKQKLSNEPTENNITIQLSSFLSELKLLICPLIQLLTNLINKLVLKNDA